MFEAGTALALTTTSKVSTKVLGIARSGEPSHFWERYNEWLGGTRMEVTALPFNRMIGLEQLSPESGFLAFLPSGPQYTNHLGTVHASALFAVAEAASGVFLFRHFGEAASDFVPVVRRAEAKFRRPAQGRVRARSTVAIDEIARWKSELATRDRLSAAVTIEVVDESDTVVLSAVVEWFIARRKI